MHNQIIAITERDRLTSQERYLPLLACSVYAMIDCANINLVGRLPLQAKYDRLGRAMTRTGRTK